MIYFFINIVMYLTMLFWLIKYFNNRMNIINLIIILFNMNTFIIFIDKDINAFYGLLVLITSLILSYFLNLFTKNNEEIILIKDGNINFHQVLNHYSYHKLINYLKHRHIPLNEVAYCIKKNNNLTVIRNKDVGFPISLIVDGKMFKENLSLINKSPEWLKKELSEKHLLIQNVRYAYFQKDKIYFINN